MARTVSAAALLARVRARGDIRAVRHTDAVVNEWLDESYAELYDIMVDADPKYFMSSDTISVVSGTDNYDLPADFYKVVGMDMPLNSQQYPMESFKWSERSRLQTAGASQRSARYCIVGGKVYFRPEPAFTASVTMWYIPAPASPVAAGNPLDGIAGWEEWIVADVCIKAAMADEEDYKPFLVMREKAETRIRSMANTRDQAQPDSIRDVALEGGMAELPSYWNP